MSSIYVDKNLVSAFKLPDAQMDELIKLATETNLAVPAVARLLVQRALELPPPTAAELVLAHTKTLRLFKEGA